MVHYPRTPEINELNAFAVQNKSGFLYVRGRRRVGKTWLLTDWSAGRKDCVYFSGKKDASKFETLRQFIQTWYQATGSYVLLELKSELLSWDRVFSEILAYQTKQPHKIIFIFDEVQWIAKDGSGFIGSLKTAWVHFEKKGLISVIVCGSSNKFFSNVVGGEEKILRGMATRSALWVHPIPLYDVKKFFLLHWNDQQIALTYLMLGGIPYYLSQLEPSLGFIHAINRAIFSRESIFVQEVDEVLGLEFNKTGLQTVKKILSAIGIFGTSQAEIRKNLKIPSSTLSEIFEKLVDYGIVFPEQDLAGHLSLSKSGVETRYCVKDFYLNFYFSIYQQYLKRILANYGGKTLLFSDNILNRKGYYIENFSGKAFENLVRYLLENNPFTSQLFTKLQLIDNDFEIGMHRSQSSQIDLVVRHNRDRMVRLIECKWGKEERGEIDALRYKLFPLGPLEQRMNVIIRAILPSPRYVLECQQKQVVLITLPELFD